MTHASSSIPSGAYTYIPLYVDDICPDLTVIVSIITQLRDIFTLTDLGEAKDILGCRLIRNWSTSSITLDQEHAIHEIIGENLDPSTLPSPTPLPKDLPLPNTGQQVDKTTITKFQQLIGSLLHLSRFTRPDIAFAVNVASRYVSNPGEEHFTLIYKILRYLKGTAHYKLQL